MTDSASGISIDDLGFDTRLLNNLKRSKIFTTADLLRYSYVDLAQLTGIGRWGLRQIVVNLGKIGYELPSASDLTGANGSKKRIEAMRHFVLARLSAHEVELLILQLKSSTPPPSPPSP